MWYTITKYSFDNDKTIHGPFKTEKEAWCNMEKRADEEYRIDTEENEWDTEINKNEEIGEITIKNFFPSGTDVTEFFLFEI